MKHKFLYYEVFYYSFFLVKGQEVQTCNLREITSYSELISLTGIDQEILSRVVRSPLDILTTPSELTVAVAAKRKMRAVKTDTDFKCKRGDGGCFCASVIEVNLLSDSFIIKDNQDEPTCDGDIFSLNVNSRIFYCDQTGEIILR